MPPMLAVSTAGTVAELVTAEGAVLVRVLGGEHRAHAGFTLCDGDLTVLIGVGSFEQSASMTGFVRREHAIFVSVLGVKARLGRREHLIQRHLPVLVGIRTGAVV